jgi:fermentation-respiration switch protein FrsA (DUF1100 family)
MKKFRLKKFILAIVLIPVALTTFTLGYLYTIQEKRIFDFKPLDQTYEFQFSIPHENLTIKTDDSSISAILFKAENPKGAIYYLHGKGSNLAHSKWNKIMQYLVNTLQYDVLMIDYRGFGKSTGEITYEGLLKDALAGYDYLKQSYAEKEIIVYGLSLGTSFATYVTSINQPSLLVLEAPFYSLYDVACSTLPTVPPLLIKAVIKYPLRTDEWIQKVNCPVVIFHGTKDDIIPCDSSLRLAELVQTSCELIIIPKGDHSHLNTTKEYQKKMEEITN